MLSNPIDLLIKSISEQNESSDLTGRYLLVIDTSKCDGVIKFIKRTIASFRAWKMFMLGDFPNNSNIAQVSMISQTRFAMERGDAVIMSHSEAIHESFYDLFNQHFRKFKEKSPTGEVEVIYYTNIAVGADSRRCRVHPRFQCIVHLSAKEAERTPAPFLNRFEKYQVSMTDALEFTLLHHRLLRQIPLVVTIERAMLHVRKLIEIIGYENFVGYSHKQTVESLFITMISDWENESDVNKFIQHFLQNDLFVSSIKSSLGLTDTEWISLENE